MFGRSRCLHPTHELYAYGLLPRPFGRLSTAQCIEGSRRSTVMSMAILVETSGCCRRGSRLICQQVSLPPSGGAPDRSAPVQVCGLAPLARSTVLLALGAPLQQSAASALPEGSHRASCRGKTSFENFGSAINRNANEKLFLFSVAIVFVSPEAAHGHVYTAMLLF